MFERAASAPVTRGVGDDSDKHEDGGGEWALRQNDSRKLAGISRITTSAAQVVPMTPHVILERQPPRYSIRSNVTGSITNRYRNKQVGDRGQGCVLKS